MATLQKLRNAGPLLLIFVGLALLAFIAGDALRIFQSPQGSQSVGSINGEEISAVDFQQMYEEQSNVYKYMRNSSTLSEAELNNIKDRVWNSYLQYQVVKAEADKIGLTVTAAELRDIVKKGEDPIFRQFPIFNNEQGKFDYDVVSNMLATYEENKNNPTYMQFYECWKFMEKNIMQNALIQKYYALLSNSFISNPVAAKYAYESSTNTYDVELKVYPYSAIADSAVKVSDADLNKTYDAIKESYREMYESRDIKYVSYKVTPSAADRADLKNELSAYADSLRAGNEDYATIARLSNSEVPYSTLAWSKEAYPEEVQLQLEKAKENEVVGPFYNQSDDSYTVYKYIGKETVADSILYRTLFVTSENAERTAALTDSLLNVLNKKGADFKQIATDMGQAQSDSMWLTSPMYEGFPMVGDNLAYAKALLNGKKGTYEVLALESGNSNIIYQVIDKKNPETKYHAFVIKRTSEFSKETYNDVYNKFSQFVASCNTADDLDKNAEEYGYRVSPTQEIYNWAYGVGNISGTRDAIRWTFRDAEEGNVSPLYECGNSDNLLVVALNKINEKGYTSKEKLAGITRTKSINAKKAQKIMAEIKGKNFDELSSIAAVKTDSVKRISFAAPAYINKTSTNESAISAAVTKLQPGEVSAPIEGVAGVYVIKLIAKNAKDGEFNAANEEASLKTTGKNFANQFFMRDLVEKANIEDNRYLYF